MDSAGAHAGGRWLAEDLASVLSKASLDAVPTAVVAKAKGHLLDFLGCMLGASNIDETASVRAYGRQFGAPGDCVVVGAPHRLDAEYASLVNATVGHGFEMDDYAPRASTHPASQAAPAALAAAEELDARGADLLTAVVYGFEMSIRLGLATQPSMLVERGFHESCVHGAVSSAAAAGILYGISAHEHVMALAVAASHASGTAEYARTGGEVKRFHAGLGAMAGTRSVRLARVGLTGPPSIFEGSRGYFQAFTNDARPGLLGDGWGAEWELVNYGALKPHYCVGLVHGHMQALADLRRDHDFAVSDIDAVTLGLDRLSMVHCGAVGPEPKDMVGAQFSAEYSVAMSLVDGNGLDEYQAAAATGFSDERILALARRICLEEDQECEATEPAAALGKVTVSLADGRTLVGRGYGKGTPSNPMSQDELEDKFRSLAGRVLPDDRVDAVITAVAGLEELPSARHLAGLLSVAG